LSEKAASITSEMTLLEIIRQYPETLKIFKTLEAETGVCVCCQALFLPLGEAAQQFSFDADEVLGKIKTEIDQGQ